MPRPSENMPSSEGSREIDAARRRLAAAKHQASSTTKNLEMACAMELLARTNKERAQASVKSTQKEVDVAESALRQVEKRWGVIGIDVDAADSPSIKNNNNKRRKVTVTPKLEEGRSSNDDGGGGGCGDVNLRIIVGAAGGGAFSGLKKDSTNIRENTSGEEGTKSSAKASSNVPKRAKAAAAISDPLDKERINAAIYAVNTVYGDGAEKNKKLAATQLRGVTMRPSGKWQAQLYYSEKSRYIGVFDSKEKASLAYEIAREVLKTDKGEEGPRSAEETDRNVALARKAAFAGVNEHTGSQ